MYGGHITDDWDRRLCRTYLAEYIRTEMLEGEVLLAPGFQIPPNLDYKVRPEACAQGWVSSPKVNASWAGSHWEPHSMKGVSVIEQEPRQPKLGVEISFMKLGSTGAAHKGPGNK